MKKSGLHQFGVFPQAKRRMKKVEDSDILFVDEDDLQTDLNKRQFYSQTRTTPTFQKTVSQLSSHGSTDSKFSSQNSNNSEKLSSDPIDSLDSNSKGSTDGVVNDFYRDYRDFNSVPIVKRDFLKIESGPIVSRIAEPVRNRLCVDLPIEDLRVAQVQAAVSFEEMEHNIDAIKKQTEDTTNELKSAAHNVQELQMQAMTITQKADAISSKLNVLDDWMDGLQAAGDTVKIQVIELGVKFISILSSLILLVWHSILAANPFKLCMKRKHNFKGLKDEDTTDDTTDVTS